MSFSSEIRTKFWIQHTGKCSNLSLAIILWHVLQDKLLDLFSWEKQFKHTSYYDFWCILHLSDCWWSQVSLLLLPLRMIVKLLQSNRRGRASSLLKMLNLYAINVTSPFLTASWENGSSFGLWERALWDSYRFLVL